MSPTDAQKRASAKYQKENISSLACRVRKEDAAEFKEYCDCIGKTSNAVLREYVLDCIGKGENGMGVVTDLHIERRIRYRLKRHGMKLHKTPKDEFGNVWYQVLDIDEDPKDHAEDEYGWFKLDKLIDYAEELAEKERTD